MTRPLKVSFSCVLRWFSNAEALLERLSRHWSWSVELFGVAKQFERRLEPRDVSVEKAQQEAYLACARTCFEHLEDEGA